jgi:regulator of replication initiation timing
MNQAERASQLQPKMRLRIFFVLTSSLLLCGLPLQAQSSTEQTPASTQQREAAMERQLNEVTAALNQTQHTLEQSMQEIQRLRSQLETLRAQLPKPSAGDTAGANPAGDTNTTAATGNSTSADTIERLHEEQDALQSEIKLHEQTKIETASKYPLRVTGLVLFNAFSNAGVVDNIDLPGLALSRASGAPHGSSGASLRQTLVGIEGTGPRLWGAKSAADLSIDFFGGLTYNQYGYSTSVSDIVRLRQGKVSLAWDKTTIDAGMTNPLISPLSPTSYATVAQPALAAAGNLWGWMPQARLEQKIPFGERSSMHFEIGLLDPPSPGSAGASIQGSSAAEASRHPGIEGRLSYHGAEDPSGLRTPLAFGLSAYSSDQRYGLNYVHSWATTADWQLPISRRFTLSGEAYRGRALGGLGGGIYKDVLTGVESYSGDSATNGVDTVGGWSQAKIRLLPTLEVNAMFGLDDALASNFRRLNLPVSTAPSSYYARNNTFAANVIFRPKSYLIFSPEFRRIMTWSINGAANTADIFTLSAGYQF